MNKVSQNKCLLTHDNFEDYDLTDFTGLTSEEIRVLFIEERKRALILEKDLFKA